MKHVALEKASEHLELAKAAVQRLTLENGAKAYSQAWSDFLSQSSRFYGKLEQGVKGCTASVPWFGQKKNTRRTDPLLSYLHQARNCDEHGLDYIVTETGSSLVGKMAEGATTFHMAADVMLDSDGNVHVRNPTSETPAAFTALELSDPRMELVKVKDGRSGKSFDPPEEHLGQPIADNSPPVIANLAIEYLEEMLNEATGLPEHN